MDFDEFKESYPKLKLVYDEKDIKVTDEKINYYVLIKADNCEADLNLSDDSFYILNKIIRYEDIGFEGKDYSEFLVDFYKNNKDEIEIAYGVGEYEIIISKVSNMFELINWEVQGDKFWEGYDSIKIKRTKNHCRISDSREVLIEALFLIYVITGENAEMSNCNQNLNGFPQIIKFTGEEYLFEMPAEDLPIDTFRECFSTEIETMKFPRSAYIPPLAFFCSAKKTTDKNMSFLFYYKILEYFFKIFKVRTIDFNKSKEVDLLINVLSHIDELFIKEEIFNEKFKSVDQLGREIYSNRCKIAHGKQKFEVLYEDFIFGNKNSHFDNGIMEKIALYLIQKECYKKE